MKILKHLSARISDDAVASRIAETIIYRQRQLATYLNRKTKQLSGRGMLMILIAFSAFFGSYCIYLILHALK